jgi:inhibitor of KinA sporulation pathway (predicted exonuclease)
MGLTAFQRWLSDLAPLKEIALWGNGSDFDNVLLAQAYAAAKMDYPIRYYNNRCFRTLKNLGLAVQEPQREGTFHNALDDAKHQAKWAGLILAELRLGQTAVRSTRKIVMLGDSFLYDPAGAATHQPVAGSDGN